MELFIEVLQLAFKAPHLSWTLILLVVLLIIAALVLALVFVTRPIEPPTAAPEAPQSLSLRRAQEAARRQLVEAGQHIDMPR